jgi:hypothetical protein
VARLLTGSPFVETYNETTSWQLCATASMKREPAASARVAVVAAVELVVGADR